MKNHVVVGTYHKTGTVWMDSVFRLFCARAALPYRILSRDQSRWKDEAERDAIFRGFRDEAEAGGGFAVIFDNHSQFPAPAGLAGCRGFRVVRDPRDVLISSANYHVRSEESWLHEPRPGFGGMTYAEKLRSFERFEDRIRFEMDHIGRHTIHSMAGFAGTGDIERVKYEDLIRDTDRAFWRGLMARIGLETPEINIASEAFWHYHRAGGQKGQALAHATTSGTEAQWKDRLDKDLLGAVERRFAREIELLGYAA